VATGGTIGGPDSAIAYREVLRTPPWWYVVALGVAAILAGEFRIGGVDVTIWVPFCTLLPLSVVIVWAMGRSRVEIVDGELRVRGGRLRLSDVSGAVALDPLTLRRVVGREGDPAAFVSVRPWIKPGVQLWLDSTDGGVPYWVISTRHPRQVVELVRRQIRSRPPADPAGDPGLPGDGTGDGS
jgi:hypothetical protein